MNASAPCSGAPSSREVAPGPRWYCVQTKPRAELRAREHLERQDFECFLPRIQRHAPRTPVRGSRTLIEPLFPRYLFLRADSAAQSLAPIRSTCGVLGLVRFANQPALVPDDIVARLREDAGPDGVIVPRVVAWRPGDAVQVLSGPLEGLRGVYAQPSGEHRAVVLLKLLGGEQRVLLPADALQAAGAAHAA